MSGQSKQRSSQRFNVEEIFPSQLQKTRLHDIACWIADQYRFSPYDQISRPLLSKYGPRWKEIRERSRAQDVQFIEHKLLNNDGRHGNCRLFLATAEDNSILGIAWWSLWHRERQYEPVNEVLTAPIQDHDELKEPALQANLSIAGMGRYEHFLTLSRELRNSHLRTFQGKLREVLVPWEGANLGALSALIEKGLQWAKVEQTIAIATFPRLRGLLLPILRGYGFTVRDSVTYPFLHFPKRYIMDPSVLASDGRPRHFPQVHDEPLLFMVRDADSSSAAQDDQDWDILADWRVLSIQDPA
ncbi:hypothetical protein F4779DRAFT_622349 [Xylariaceae sp. FL0662B]|nr:hypothetical protein F4779DRAFT_622349 [Xylariaceae sp. FL0662B]